MNLNQYEISFVIKGLMQSHFAAHPGTWERVIALAKEALEYAKQEKKERDERAAKWTQELEEFRKETEEEKT